MFATDEEYEAGGELSQAVWRGETVYVERRHVRRDGAHIWCSISGRAVQPGDPAQGSVWLFDDITSQRESEDRVQLALAEQELILDNAAIGIAFVRNRAIRALQPLPGRHGRRRPGRAHRPEQHGCVRLAKRLAGSRPHRLQRDRAGRDATNRSSASAAATASTSTCRTRGRRIDMGEPEQEWIWSLEDVTVEREAELRVQEVLGEPNARSPSAPRSSPRPRRARSIFADHDALTGLPTARLLEDRLRKAALSNRNRKASAVMFADIDRFKMINDLLGHAVGDALLKEIASRLVNQLREGDTIRRIGGDEFVVVLPEVRRSSDVALVAHKVIEQLSTPVIMEERELVVSCSIGIAVYPDDGRDAETLIRNADAAMYHAKELGRANYQFFTDQMNQAVSRRLQLESQLRRAVGKGELCLYYQPIAELRTDVAAYEALARWQHPERGLVLPAEFIQLAEESESS